MEREALVGSAFPAAPPPPDGFTLVVRGLRSPLPLAPATPSPPLYVLFLKLLL